MKEYFEDLYNIDTQEEVTVHICGLDGIRRSNYLGGEPIERAEVELRGISFFSVIGKIYARILVDRVRKVTGGLIDDELGSFRAEWVCRSDLHTEVDR